LARRLLLPFLLLLSTAVATACSEARVHAAAGLPQAQCGGRPPATTSAGAVSRLYRVVVVVMENKSCAQVVGSRQAPYLNGLARRYAFASRYFALTKPSLPNYVGLMGGSTFGIAKDCIDCTVHATNLVDQLERAGISWKAYMESMPRPCFRGVEAGRYVKRHNPFLYYANIASDARRCRRVVPLDRLFRDVASGALPRYVWISPDLCHDMHSCPTRQGDRFLSRLVPMLLRAVGPRGAIFVTWDEGADRSRCCRLAAGGNVPLLVAGPGARPGARTAIGYDHYSLLRTIEDAFGLPRLRGAACRCTRPLSGLLR
jgi:phosphatidylinositol-3-phosphatase